MYKRDALVADSARLGEIVHGAVIVCHALLPEGANSTIKLRVCKAKAIANTLRKQINSATVFFACFALAL